MILSRIISREENGEMTAAASRIGTTRSVLADQISISRALDLADAARAAKLGTFRIGRPKQP